MLECRSSRICHGRKNKQKQKHLPRINTEFHGKDRSRDTERRASRSNRHGNKTLLSEPDALATVATLRKRIQLFIAYLYKLEAQAKVLQIPVYYSHIIPSLALQACKTRDTVKSRFPNPPLNKTKVAAQWA